jgi:hypothetical protein
MVAMIGSRSSWRYGGTVQDALAGVEVFQARERSLMELRELHNPGSA